MSIPPVDFNHGLLGAGIVHIAVSRCVQGDVTRKSRPRKPTFVDRRHEPVEDTRDCWKRLIIETNPAIGSGASSATKPVLGIAGRPKAECRERAETRSNTEGTL